MYLPKRASTYIHLKVSFLFTRVREYDTDNYNNMAMVMKYIQGIISLPLILSIDQSGNIQWYVDEEFAVHKDMRNHTGVFVTMGIGGYYF